MRYIIFTICLSVLGLVACQTPTTQKTEPELAIKMIKYYVRYIEQGKELQVEAKFANDSIFAMPGGVFVQNFKLEAKKLDKEGWTHRYNTRNAKFDSVYVFKYSVSKNKAIEDTVAFPIFNDLKLETPKVSKKSGGLLSWQGEALTQDDGLTLIFEDSEGKTFSNNHTGISRGTQFEIRPEYMQTLANGKGVLRIVHTRTTIEKIGDTRIVRQMGYYRLPLEIEIVN